MKKYCLAIDLVNDPELISEYLEWHRNVWPSVKESIKAAGITDMEIFRAGDRLFMIMEVSEAFSFEKKAEIDASDPSVQEWEKLMWKYQKPLPGTREGEKWTLLEKIFSLNK